MSLIQHAKVWLVKMPFSCVVLGITVHFNAKMFGMWDI